jgi:hypothetical protein
MLGDRRYIARSRIGFSGAQECLINLLEEMQISSDLIDSIVRSSNDEDSSGARINLSSAGVSHDVSWNGQHHRLSLQIITETRRHC